MSELTPLTQYHIGTNTISIAVSLDQHITPLPYSSRSPCPEGLYVYCYTFGRVSFTVYIFGYHQLRTLP